MRSFKITFFRCITFVYLFFNLISLFALPSSQSVKIILPGHVYTMRGGILGIFSTGMNKLANDLNKTYNINAAHTVYRNSTGLSSYIINNYRAGKITGPIILVGHSLGANEQIKVAYDLWYARIPVALLITVDAGAPAKIPENVENVLNLYQPTVDPIFKGLPVEALNSRLTKINNIDVSKLQNINVNHFTISQNEEMQKLMLSEILRVLKEESLKAT